jgi:hypothetical protein
MRQYRNTCKRGAQQYDCYRFKTLLHIYLLTAKILYQEAVPKTRLVSGKDSCAYSRNVVHKLCSKETARLFFPFNFLLASG